MDGFGPLAVLTALVYGVVIAAAIRNWYRTKSAAIQAGIDQALDDGADPQMEARIVGKHRK
jgi:branched-subunit amino acid permease